MQLLALVSTLPLAMLLVISTAISPRNMLLVLPVVLSLLVRASAPLPKQICFKTCHVRKRVSWYIVMISVIDLSARTVHLYSSPPFLKIRNCRHWDIDQLADFLQFDC